MTRSRPATPITAHEFADAMTAFAPFEQSPHLAVAVSGGADSMALVILADAWARAVDGAVTALIVEHGLRPESAAEASLTAARLMRRGINAEVLSWQGEKPKTGLQAAARQARYALLDDWCRRHGVLHLAVAHHADDQAETFMMRLKRGSGPDGLAAMSPVRELGACRLLRPLLGFSKERLVATLEETGLDWVEDPSNRDPKYARTQVRVQLAASSGDACDLNIATARFARARSALEAATADWLARHAALDPAGYLTFSTADWLRADDEIRLRVLARAAQAIGGKVFAPEVAGLERLAASLEGGHGATLGRAHFDPGGASTGVYREARNLPAPVDLTPGIRFWDQRFRIAVRPGTHSLSVRPWGAEIAESWPKEERPAWLGNMPSPARAGLPVIALNGRYYLPADEASGVEPEKIGVSVRFQPTMPLSGSGFSVA